MPAGAQPFHDPRLRDRLAGVRRSLDQVIDKVTGDELLSAGSDAAALDKARTLVTDFRAFVAANRDELEAVRVFTTRPHRLVG